MFMNSIKFQSGLLLALESTYFINPEPGSLNGQITSGFRRLLFLKSDGSATPRLACCAVCSERVRVYTCFHDKPCVY